MVELVDVLCNFRCNSIRKDEFLLMELWTEMYEQV